MAARSTSTVKIVLPSSISTTESSPINTIFRPSPILRPQQFAPAWFYSALSWLGKSYYDASNVRQSFCNYLAGSDVDPYAKLGATRLFLVTLVGETFRLTLSGDVNSSAPATGGVSYPNNDDGIAQMYTALSQSPIFEAIKYCYVPGRLGPDLNPNELVGAAFAVETPGALPNGYDPATGLRAVVLGSAVAQVVPIDDFTKTRNEQIYDDGPAIVPLVAALVYDVTQYNQLGATTFVLPTYYARDQVTFGTYYVSRLGGTTTAEPPTGYGQTVIFPGGPGYSAAGATALTVKSSSPNNVQGQTFTTYIFDTATVVTIETVAPSAQLGVMSLTYRSSSPASLFANQRIVGFYRDASWKTCLGVPIYDYAGGNASFTVAETQPLADPTTIYDPTHPFLNGGTLQNVASKLIAASYVYSTDRLAAMLEAAISDRNADNGAGLSVTTAALDFTMHSSAAASLVDRLSVPVLVTVTTTPAPVPPPPGNTATRLAPAEPAGALAAGAVSSARINPVGTISRSAGILETPQPVGTGGNATSQPQQNPSSVQLGLNAFVPQEALAGTGIVNLEIGTAFPTQSLGDGATFEAASAGVALNLMDRGSNVKPAFPPYNLTLAGTGITFAAGVTYILSLQGGSLNARGSDGSTASATLKQSPSPDANHTYVGAMVYSSALTTVRLYAKLSLALPAPAVGTGGVLQGDTYSVRLTYGKSTSQYDVLDATQTLVIANASVANPSPSDGSKPQPGDLYFGSFIGGATQMTLWSVPVLLNVAPSQLQNASFNGTLTLAAQTSGVPGYELQITDSSLFVYSNINVDTAAVGSVSSNNVFLASAVINAAPDDGSSKAFAPCQLLMGLIRQVQMGTQLAYVFIPEADSVLIGGTRYMVGVINLANLAFDPNSLPYAPVFWPQSQYWQFANRHNPYLDVEYSGADENARVARAKADTARIGLQTARAQEPMQLYLDTNRDEMTVWPIFPFPYAAATQSVDRAALQSITSTILGLLNTTFPPSAPSQTGPLDAERITLPASLQQNNPFTAGATFSSDATPAVNSAITAQVASPSLAGLQVTDLAPQAIEATTVRGLEARQSVQAQQAQVEAAVQSQVKSRAPAIAVTQQREVASVATSVFGRPQYQPIFGFSIFNPGTGEAYLVELVGTDLQPPDQLPNPTKNADYDPYYVRVVFLKTLTCYNMTIIVPAMAHDQYGHFAHLNTAYSNVLGKTDELGLGYMYSLYDADNNFDDLNFSPYPDGEVELSPSQTYVFTNLPYNTQQRVSFSPLTLYAQMTHSAFKFDESLIVYHPLPAPPAYFVCRRKNWSADCHLMQSTHATRSAAYMAFGGGDLVPFQLDADFDVDKRQPAHMFKLTYTFADRQYESAKTFSVANTPYVVAVTIANNSAQYVNFSINATAGTTDLQITKSQPLQFPTECYVVGEASATVTDIGDIAVAAGAGITDTGGFFTVDQNNQPIAQFAVIPYNNLVYLVRAVANIEALGYVGGNGAVSGFLIDTFVPGSTGYLKLAQGARYQRSGLSFFGASYTPTTLVDSLDTLDFTGITGAPFYAPTIFIPIPEIDATKSFVADLSNFLGQQIWTFVYPEIVAQPGETVNGKTYSDGYNLDAEGKPVLSLQKLQYVYDPLVVLFTPNDLAHKYPLIPKQQILALTNGQIQEGICWRSANLQPLRNPPSNICAQQILPPGIGMDRPNIVYSLHNRPVTTPTSTSYLGMSVNSFVSVSGVAYNVEESGITSNQAYDQTASSFVSAVSSGVNMLVAVLFDYDNNDLGTLDPYDPGASTKGVVFLNGYLGAAGYTFSSPDHFDVNDVLRSQVPLLEQIADVFGWDVALYDTDVSLPRQFWSLVYDTFTGPGLPDYIANVPPSIADPAFTNRTRSLILSLQNDVRPQQLGLMDTYGSVVSANLHLQNGVTGSIFLSKKADRDVASIGTNPGAPSFPALYGLPAKYDFFIFSRDHYATLKNAQFELIDLGYAMCLVDDGSGTGTKIAQYFVDSDGNYNELYAYALYSLNGGIIETNTFTLKVTLGTPANLSATPILPETPNNVNPQDLVAQINKLSTLIYAAFGPSTPGQPPAFLPIQAVGGEVQAAPIVGPPGFNGYALNVVGVNRQPVTIAQIYSGASAYAIAGSTSSTPINPKTGKALPFYGSLAHGLDRQRPSTTVQSKDLKSYLTGTFGGDGLGAMIATPFSAVFQGTGGDNGVYYTFNALTNAIVDSTNKTATVSGGQYFIDTTDSANAVVAVVTLPKFTLNNNTYTVNLSTTLSDGVTSRYTLVVGGKSYLFDPDNAHVTVDHTTFTFNPLAAGAYTVTYASTDAPAGGQAPSPLALTPFSVAAGGAAATIDVFNNSGGLGGFVLGPPGRTYAYDPVHGTVTVKQGATVTKVSVATGSTFVSASNYGYVVGFSNQSYTVNGVPMFPYSASTLGTPASYALMTAPQMFTIGGNFYTFDLASGAYVSVTGNGQTYPVNPYQFSLNGKIYIINTNVQPNAVVGGGNTYPMTAGNTQFSINGVQYTIALKQNSLNGATVSGQYNIVQGNVVVIENYVYQLDTLNGQIVGNGTAYPLTTAGFTYTISTAGRSFTVTTEPNDTTFTVGNVVYSIGDTTVVGDGIPYPILVYRSFTDGAITYDIGLDGTVALPPPLSLTGAPPYTRATFTDGGTTYTVNDLAAFDGTAFHLISGSPPQFTASGLTYTLRNDGVAIAAGSSKTYLVNPGGPLSPNQFAFGTKTIFFGRASDVAAFDGIHYYAISGNSFTDSNTGKTYTLSGNTAVNEGNSYEIFSNLGQGAYFEVPGGPTYFINVAVADTGTASGDIYSVFPISGGQFAIPLIYTITIVGSNVSVAAITFASTPMPTLTASGGALTGGYFVDPVTKITYTCLVDAGKVTFVDSNNAVSPYPAPGSTNTFVANVAVSTGVSLAVDNEATSAIYPIVNNQFAAGTTTYLVNVPVAYSNAAAGPYWQMVNGRFIVPRTDPLSSLAYTVQGGSVVKGYVISGDDEFSADGNVVYTINAVNVVKATNQAKLSGTEPNQTLTLGASVYALNTTTARASIQPAGLKYNAASKQFTVSFNGLNVTYTVGAGTVSDNRVPVNSFPATLVGSQLSFTDTIGGVTVTFDDSGNNPITAVFLYTNHFFTDALSGITFYIDETDNRVEALSYLPETTAYGFVPADGKTYLIHYSDVSVVFPVVSGAEVSAGVATVGSDMFTVHIDEVEPASGAPAIPIDRNSFEINGNLYTITGTPAGADYSSCFVVGAGAAPKKFLSANTFQLSDPAVTYTLQLDGDDQPSAVVADFTVKPSQDLLLVDDDVYVITYNSTSTGSLLGQGQPAIPIVNSAFTLTNPFDTTRAKFIFADLNIYDAASVVGQFTVYAAPTFFIGSAIYTFDSVALVVSDNDKRPFPLISNPTMFSINGYNYVIDTNRTPHAIVGNNNVSPLATDVTVVGGHPVPNSTFTLNGLVYAYVEDTLHNLLTIVGTKTYPIAQPGLTFKLDSSLIFTISKTPPAAGSYPGTTAPIGTVTAAGVTLYLYAGTPESGNSDFFTYKNVLYTLIKSLGTYEAVQKSYTVYVAQPASTQQQLAAFDIAGSTYLVTDGTTAGAATPAGINPGTMWAATAVTKSEVQFGVVYGFGSQPLNVLQSSLGVFQFQVTDSNNNITLYDIVYTKGNNANVVKVDVPQLLPSFMQSGRFAFVAPADYSPLTFETGGYNAFTTSVAETATPLESFSAAYKTPVTSTAEAIDSLIAVQGDFSVEFWHSLPLWFFGDYHPFTYAASSSSALVYYVDIVFQELLIESNVLVAINGVVMSATATPPVFSSGWRHVALTYEQPYAMLCDGAGFEVKQATNYDFGRDFSIAMTFSASDVNTKQGLLYKGTGSDVTPPELSMSYRVTVENAAVSLEFTNGEGKVTKAYTGQAVLQADTFYELIIVKRTSTPSSSPGGDPDPDPYTPPFDLTDLGKAANGGFTASGSVGGGGINVSGIQPAGAGATTRTSQFIQNLGTAQSDSYTIDIAVRTVSADGGFGNWQWTSTPDSASQAGVLVNSTGSAHLLIGYAYDDVGQPIPPTATGVINVRTLYLFNGAIRRDGIRTDSGDVNIADASSADLLKAGIVGYWQAQYDPNGVVNNPLDANSIAISTNQSASYLVPLSGFEVEGTSLYVNGYEMTLTKVANPQSGMFAYPGSSLLLFNAGTYRLQEISLWQVVRQAYQVVDDMFGRLIPSNEPDLAVYLSGSFEVQAINAPILPLNKFIDDIGVTNGAAVDLNFSNASLDLAGCPAVGRCGPLITPNLYTPPGIALTVCDTVPELTTYSVTLNNLTTSLAGEINEAYVYIKNHVLTLYAGKKVGDLVLTWVSQEQGDVQLIGYIEGAPPCPAANMTNKPGTTFLEPNTIYPGATSITLTAGTSATLRYRNTDDSTDDNITDQNIGVGIEFGCGEAIAPFGIGVALEKALFEIKLNASQPSTDISGTGTDNEETSSTKLDETNRYVVKLQGTYAPITGDQFMASINTLTTPSETPGNPSSKTAILPNPNLGGFTASNPPAALPKAPTDEKFGARMFLPSPYGEAFVTSQTLDVYQQTLVQSNTVYGFVRVPNAQIPRDLNIVSFRMSSKYLRPGCLDGVVGYVYNPATLPTGAETYATSTGQMQVLYDGNFSPGEVGHDASYMRVIEAYKVKKQIDQQAFNALALYQTAYNKQGSATDPTLTPGLDFYNEYVWSSRGGTQEVKHTFATSYEEVYATSTNTSHIDSTIFNLKLIFAAILAEYTYGSKTSSKETIKYIYSTAASSAFDIAASFDGLETDTQMRYACNNDAHFVLNNNSMFNPNNQSGLNLVIGSDGLVYNIVPSVTSGAGLPQSDNIDSSRDYVQPQPAYFTGNADGLSGALEPYDRPGKIKLFRTLAFFLQPAQQNADDFWSTVVDRVWLDNSQDTDAAAMRSAEGNVSIPWRLFYRVTYCERFLPPVSSAAVVVPQIEPLMAVPVLNPPTDFLYMDISAPGSRPAHNPANDIEANIVLAAPTATGKGGSTLPNNVIPFDIVKGTASVVNWGDSNNAQLLGKLLTSALGLNTVLMSPQVSAGSTKVMDVADPAGGSTLYSVYTDPNGLTVNVAARFGITVYQDVNGNPIQYYDGQTYHSLQSDYVASPDGSVMYYVQPPSGYDQSACDLSGDYDLFGHPGDEWRYYLVSGMSVNMTSEPTVSGLGPFLQSGDYAGFTVATAQHSAPGVNQVQGYVLAQGILQWPQLNTNAETFADVQVYKAMSLLDTFPIGDPEVLIQFLQAQYPGAPFVNNNDINLVFARNIVSYFNAAQQALIPQ